MDSTPPTFLSSSPSSRSSFPASPPLNPSFPPTFPTTTSSASTSSPPPLPPQSPPTISLTIQPTIGQSFLLSNISPSASISAIKGYLAARLGFPASPAGGALGGSGPSPCHLLFLNRELTGGTLGEHGIRDGATLNVTPAMRTGPLRLRQIQVATGSEMTPEEFNAVLKVLTNEQIAFLQRQKRPIKVTAKLGERIVSFVFVPQQLLPSSPSPSPSPLPQCTTTSSSSSSSSSSSCCPCGPCAARVLRKRHHRKHRSHHRPTSSSRRSSLPTSHSPATGHSSPAPSPASFPTATAAEAQAADQKQQEALQAKVASLLAQMRAKKAKGPSMSSSSSLTAATATTTAAAAAAAAAVAAAPLLTSSATTTCPDSRDC